MNNEFEIYKINNLPIFQNRMFESSIEAKNCQRGDVRLVQNLITGLIYNADFLPEIMTYDENYQNEQAVSPEFQKHLYQVKKIIQRSIGIDGLIEVGCGKGYFLELLIDSGFDITGFDPTYEGKNPRIKKNYFQSGVGITANGLILRHVLEHVKDPFSFLMGLAAANANKGLIYIEVPCFDWICNHRAWFDVFYEHVNYFRIDDFRRMFGNIHEIGHSFGGQYLYIVADLSSLKPPKILNQEKITLPADFLRSINYDSSLEKTAVWGGASKGVIFCLLRERLNKPIDLVIDINPAKQGKFLPATGLRVYSPDEGLNLLPLGSTIYIMNSNYLEEIKTMSNNSYKYVSIDSGKL